MSFKKVEMLIDTKDKVKVVLTVIFKQNATRSYSASQEQAGTANL